jgi:prephenate dehydrogenase
VAAPTWDVARSRGIIDHAVTLDADWTGELAGADVVLLATRSRSSRSLFAAIGPHLPKSAILTDAGSTKQNVIAEARAHLKAALPQFIPGHPIAGPSIRGLPPRSRRSFATATWC